MTEQELTICTEAYKQYKNKPLAMEIGEILMKIERKWAMPSLWTFTIKPIKELLIEEVENPTNWIDPFAGYNSIVPLENQNDLDINSPSLHKKCALDFLKSFGDDSIEGILYDPPYSITQAKNYGNKKFCSMKYWADCKNECARIIKPNGKIICCGWSSMGLGLNRKFSMKRILLVPHGGSKNDTIVTVEIKQ